MRVPDPNQAPGISQFSLLEFVDGKKRGVSMEKRKAGTKERSPVSLSLPNQNTILININGIILKYMEKIQ